ncbi:MAG: glycosyltransferase family 87 protein [Chloroflexota bacterium]
MRNQRQDRAKLGVIIFALLLAGGLTWAIYQYAAKPDTTDNFAPLWAAARQVITDRTNPYDLNALRYYFPEGTDPDSRFVYPFYGMLIFLPFGLISSYPLAKAIWMILLVVALLAVIFGTLSLTRWNPSAKLLGAVVLFSLIGYPTVRGLYSGNPALLIAMLITLGLRMVILGRDRAAGVLFGLTILKPTMVALLLPYVLLYAVSHRNSRLIRSALVTMSLLIAAAFLAYPQWFVQNFAAVVLLFNDSFPSSISAVLSSWLPGNQLMVVIAALVGLWTVMAWWQSLGKDTRWFLWTASLTLVLTELIGIPTTTANYVSFLIPLILSFSILEQRWEIGGGILVMLLIIFMLFATWAPFLLITGADPALPEPRIMLFLLPMIVIGLLYWVRYWALTSIRMQVERYGTLSNI